MNKFMSDLTFTVVTLNSVIFWEVSDIVSQKLILFNECIWLQTYSCNISADNISFPWKHTNMHQEYRNMFYE